MSKFLTTSEFKCVDPNKFDLNKYTSNYLKGCILEVYLVYPKESCSDYPLVSDKTEIKRETLSNYQIKIYDFHNIAICNAKNLVINVFDKDRYALHCENLQLYLRNTLRLKKIHRILEFN